MGHTDQRWNFIWIYKKKTDAMPKSTIQLQVFMNLREYRLIVKFSILYIDIHWYLTLKVSSDQCLFDFETEIKSLDDRVQEN